MITTSGGEASRSKHFTQTLFVNLTMEILAFDSSAIETITASGDEVTITFNGGRDYTYGISDVEQFVTELNSVITNDQSVGRFINEQIKSERLQQMVAA